MRLRVPLLGVLLAFLAPAPVDAAPLQVREPLRVLDEADDDEVLRAPLAGVTRTGPGYHVWAETRQEADAWVRALARVRRGPRDPDV